MSTIKAIRMVLTRLNGNKYFHSSVRIWSILSLGNVHFNHMIRYTTKKVLPKNQTKGGIKSMTSVKSRKVSYMKGHPSAKEYGCSYSGNDKHIHEFSEEKEGKADTGIFGMESGRQFRFCLGQVKGPAVDFCRAGYHENNKSHQSREMSLEYPPAVCLTHDDFRKLHGAAEDHNRKQGQSH